MKVTGFSLRQLISAFQTLEELLYLAALNFERLPRHCRCRPTRAAASWTGVTRADRRHRLTVPSRRRIVRVTIMIVGKSLGVIRRGWMIEQ